MIVHVKVIAGAVCEGVKVGERRFQVETGDPLEAQALRLVDLDEMQEAEASEYVCLGACKVVWYVSMCTCTRTVQNSSVQSDSSAQSGTQQYSMVQNSVPISTVRPTLQVCQRFAPCSGSKLAHLSPRPSWIGRCG